MLGLVMQSFAGFFVLMLIGYIFSESRKSINWKLIFTAFILQNVLFLVIIYVPIVHSCLRIMSQVLLDLMDYSQTGAEFVFGNLTNIKQYGFVFVFVSTVAVGSTAIVGACTISSGSFSNPGPTSASFTFSARSFS